MAITLSSANRTLRSERDEARRLLVAPLAPPAGEVQEHALKVAAASSDVDAAWRRRAGTATTVALLVVGTAPGLVLLGGYQSTKDWYWGGAQLKYHAVAALSTALIWLLIGLIFKRDRGGLARTVIGKGNSLSTSKLQVLLWTFALSYAFMLFVVIYIWEGSTTGFDKLNADYLFLLGGPFAAALLAQASTAAKVNGNALQQPDKSSPTSSDLVEDASGNASITDAQFLVFNIVALTYFYATLVHDPMQLPDLPNTLIGLTSLSALTYVGGKLTNTNAPVIKSISIISGSTDGLLHSDNTVRIVGENFQASTTQTAEVTLKTIVLFGTVEAIPDSIAPNEIVAHVPAGLPPGDLEVQVRTGAATVSEPYTRLKAA